MMILHSKGLVIEGVGLTLGLGLIFRLILTIDEIKPD